MNTQTILKWVGLFAAVSAALTVAFNSFLPAYFKWREDFPDAEPEPEYEPTPQTPFVAGGLTDVMQNSTFADKENSFENEAR